MDKTARLWDVETGKQVARLDGHDGEIVSLHFNSDGDKLLSGSFDKTAMVFRLSDVDMGCQIRGMYTYIRRAYRRNIKYII